MTRISSRRQEKLRCITSAASVATACLLGWANPAHAIPGGIGETTLSYTFTWTDWGGVNTHPLINNEVNFVNVNSNGQDGGPLPATDSNGQVTLVTNGQFETNGTLDLQAQLPAVIPNIASVYSSAANAAA